MTRRFTLKFKKMRESARIPKRATDGSAAVDLHACLTEPVTIMPRERYAVPTGLAIEIPRSDMVALTFSRSGMGRKAGVSLANSVGVIDSDYRGEMSCVLINHGDEPFTVEDGDRIAQLMLTYALPFDPVEAHELSSTERGEGGYGSTGVK